MSTAAATESPAEVVVAEGGEPLSARIVRFLGRTPVYLFLAFVGVLWLVPTLGLLFTSLLEPAQIGRTGWWEIFSKPSIATLENYREVFDNDAITSAIWTTVLVSVGGTILPIAASRRSLPTRSRGSSSRDGTGCSSASSHCWWCRSRWR